MSYLFILFVYASRGCLSVVRSPSCVQHGSQCQERLPGAPRLLHPQEAGQRSAHLPAGTGRSTSQLLPKTYTSVIWLACIAWIWHCSSFFCFLLLYFIIWLHTYSRATRLLVSLTAEDRTGHHRLIKHPEQRPVDVEGPQWCQKIETALAFYVFNEVYCISCLFYRIINCVYGDNNKQFHWQWLLKVPTS